MEKRRRALLLDTDPDALITLQHALEEADIDATVTWNEMEACQLIETTSYDLILVGDHPPELNAAAILDDLSLRGTCPPVLILRRIVGEGEVEYFCRIGAIGVVPKRDTLAVLDQVRRQLASIQFKAKGAMEACPQLTHGEPPHKPGKTAMLDKCANPACFAAFRSLRDGKLFVTEVDGDNHSGVCGPGRQRQYYWFCNSCCRNMTVTIGKGKRAQVIPLPESAIAARAAS